MANYERSSGPKFYTLVFVILILAIFGIAGVYLVNFRGVRDWVSNLSYSPDANVLALEEAIGLTDEAKTTFRATRPALEGQSAFNEHCQSYDVEISVLGCYTKDRIYVYNVDYGELEGVVESTAAHEFLHAAWDRLAENERAEVSGYLNAVYAEHRDELSEEMGIYDDEEQLDELHSRVGTQIADLPEYLEKYYARYFKDQDRVVAYYDGYISPFKVLQAQAESLKAELGEMRDEIDAETEEYYARSEELAREVAEFNKCVDAAECYTTTAEANARREELLDEQAELEEMYSSVNAKVAEYNEKVEEYNSSILRTEELQKAINSNVNNIKEINYE